jgi:hypothetical protein
LFFGYFFYVQILSGLVVKCIHDMFNICYYFCEILLIYSFGKVPTRELNKKSIYLLVILFIIQILMLLHHNSRILCNHSILTICLNTFDIGVWKSFNLLNERLKIKIPILQTTIRIHNSIVDKRKFTVFKY